MTRKKLFSFRLEPADYALLAEGQAWGQGRDKTEVLTVWLRLGHSVALANRLKAVNTRAEGVLYNAKTQEPTSQDA